MKIILIEDEKAAVRNLTSLIYEVLPSAEISAVLDSIVTSVEWFRENPAPDLAFMDIHLADGSAFEIFELVEVNCPLIFTTGYDEYALKAFKVNSIDYLLKPIAGKDLKNAVEKWKFLKKHPETTMEEVSGEKVSQLIRRMHRKTRYKSHLLLPYKGTKLLPVAVNSILFFHIREGVVKAYTREGKTLTLPQTLDELSESLDPDCFFRINRQCILSRGAIRDIDLWFNGRLSVNLIQACDEKILVTKSRVTDFKNWFSGEEAP